MGLSTDERAELIRRRKERVLTYITQDPPVPFANILAMEGMEDRPLRIIIKELEAQYGVTYLNTGAARMSGAIPHGLTEATHRFRSNLGDALYKVTDGDTSIVGAKGRGEVAPLVGLNPREQIRAETKPHAHDWTLSQIERLARALGQDPTEFIIRCLKT